MPFYSVGV